MTNSNPLNATLTGSDAQVYDNIHNLYHDSYTKDAFKEASKREKFFYKLGKNSTLAFGAILAVGFAVNSFAHLNSTVSLVALVAANAAQLYFSRKLGLYPIQDKAEENFENDFFSGALFTRYEQDIQKEDFNETMKPVNKIYSADHEKMRLKTLMNTFNTVITEHNKMVKELRKDIKTAYKQKQSHQM